MKFNLVKLFFITLLGTHLSHSQWTKDKGNGYYKLSVSSLLADEHFTSSREKDPNSTRGTFVVSYYNEIGLSKKIDLISYIPLLTRVYQNNQVSKVTGNLLTKGEAVNSIGDIDLGLRYGIIKNDYLALSSTVKFGLPTGKSIGGSDGSLQTGDGEFNQLVQLDLGIPFKIKNQNLYGKTYSGFNNRTNGFSDEFHFGGEVGTIISNKIFLAIKSSNVRSFNNGNLSDTGQGIFANNVEYTNLAGEVAYYISKQFGVSFNYTAVLTGKITYAAPTYTGGIFLDIK